MQALEPNTPKSARGAAIVFLHGAGGNIDFWTSRFGPFLQAAGIALYAPHYFDRTGTVRADFATISDGKHAPQWLETVDAALHFVASRPAVDPTRIVLAGISLGAFLSLALAAELSSNPDPAQQARIRAIVEISGGLASPYDRLATANFPPTLILHGTEDSIVPVDHATSLDRKLTSLDISHRTELLTGEGHWFSPAALPRILMAVSGFLEEHLKDPQQRVPAM